MTMHVAVIGGIVLIFGVAMAQDLTQDLTRDLPSVVQDEVAKIGGRGTAAVIASAARSTGVEGEREYQLEAWSSDNSGVRSGAVRIQGFAELPTGDLGDVRWRITGKEIRGYLVKDGANVASFSGVIAEGGAEGEVTSWSGESGSWEWDGPVEKASDEAQPLAADGGVP